jgi:hypothetical protein
VSSIVLQRRAAVLALVVVVSLAHWWLAKLLPDMRLGEGSAERMPRRIEVAYVRDLAQTAPPAAPPVVVRARKPARPKAAAAKVAEAASAPVAQPAPPVVESAAVAQAETPEPQSPAASVETPPEVAVAASSAVSAASAASAPTAFEWPPSTRLSYQLSGNYRGEVSGGAQVEWVRAGARYQVHMDVWVGTQSAPLVARRMTSDGELTDNGLKPKRYDEETRALFREARRRTIEFEPDRVVLPQGRVGENVPGLQDAASQFVQLTWLFTTHPELLQVGRVIEMPLALTTRVDQWFYDVVGKDTLATPAGPVEGYHMKPRRAPKPGGDLVVDVWFAPTLQYLPVRLLIRQDDATYVDLMLDRAPQQAAPER